MATETPFQPSTLFQWYLVNRCGHHLLTNRNGFPYFRHGDRFYQVPGTKITCIPPEDQDAAEEFENSFPPSACFPHPDPSAYLSPILSDAAARRLIFNWR